MLRPTIAEISRSAIEANLNAVRRKVPRAGILAVVKANAYGHGAGIVARILENRVRGFGVATVEEGLELRALGIKKPVLVLGALWPFSSFAVAARSELVPTISSLSGLEALEKTASRLNRRIPFYLKIDTGMGIIGARHDRAAPLLEAASSTTRGCLCRGVYSHFASADFDPAYTKLQYERFLEVKKAASRLKGFSGAKFSISNSAGIFFYPRATMDAVRPGIALYGLQPSSLPGRRLAGLTPAMSFKTRIVYLKKIPKGSSVSYARRFIARRDTLIATVPAGYADGYRTGFGGGARAIVRGRYVKVAGRITMDMTTFDVTGVPRAVVGDEVILIGRSQKNVVTVEELAELDSAINYEIVCGISSRVPRVEAP